MNWGYWCTLCPAGTAILVSAPGGNFVAAISHDLSCFNSYLEVSRKQSKMFVSVPEQEWQFG